MLHLASIRVMSVIRGKNRFIKPALYRSGIQHSTPNIKHSARSAPSVISVFSVVPKFHRAAPPCHISNDRAEGSISHLASIRAIRTIRGKIASSSQRSIVPAFNT
ncbi:hypothetical protein [Rubritalea tangerina]|uniref:hypothetical protein n=1 Tax=Rubritalea tangerina TaxID=430798 RepID=UPI00361BB55A